MTKCLLLLVAACTLAACSGDRDIRDYYFPARELVNTDGKVYAYENTGTLPGPDTIYWYYLGVDLDTALYLSITRYAGDFSPQQLAQEEVTNDGIRMRKLTVFSPDTSGIVHPTEMDIIFDKSFPFYLRETPEAYGYRMSGQMKAGSSETTFVTLNRHFRKDTSVFVLGEERAAIIFDLAGEVSLRSQEDGDFSPSFSGYEIYAKGVGLVEYHRNLGAGGTLGGKLANLSGMAEFAARQLPR